MFSQLTALLCGPFFYPVYFASFLHAFDFFLNFTTPSFPQSEPRSPLTARAGDRFRIAARTQP
jgi:hypothetical protein